MEIPACIYGVLVEDRHCDHYVEVWTNREEAIARAKSIAEEYCRYPDAYEEQDIKGLEFFAQYSGEGDCVRVKKLPLDTKSDA